MNTRQAQHLGQMQAAERILNAVFCQADDLEITANLRETLSHLRAAMSRLEGIKDKLPA